MAIDLSLIVPFSNRFYPKAGDPGNRTHNPIVMSVFNSPDPCGEKKISDRNTGHHEDNVMSYTADVSNMATRGSPRFGALSHHSFFSRHNPHPHRVTHIPGERPYWTKAPYSICIAEISCLFDLVYCVFLLCVYLYVCVCLTIQENEEEGLGLIRRKTQYSAKTGRIIPPSSQAYQRSHQAQTHRHPPAPALHQQELMVLELLCQILQTDSLSLVQQWLLLAGQREKDMVMGLIQQAMKDSVFLRQQSMTECEVPRCHPRTSLSGRVLTSCGHAKLRLHTRLVWFANQQQSVYQVYQGITRFTRFYQVY
uniref:Thymus, brain and testes associated n=1 Tax=Oncorhynchus mykiss TaxID=8022 RepID=A0A8K9WRR8_ONCMY